MKGDETAVEVQRINSEFYHAFESLSIENMDRLWKHEDDNAVCIHPGWDLFTGWLAIRESWITIFRNTEMIKVVCLENIETSINGQITRFGVIATNVFEHDEENGWLLFHHHGSSVSNYIPPNISSEY